MFDIALTAFATFFVTVSPLKAAPVFATLTEGWRPEARRRAAIRCVTIAAAVLVGFGIGGDDLLRLFGISLPALRVGGGILLLLLSINMVSGPASTPTDPPERRAEGRDIAVFPMAMPMLAGPATITAVLVHISPHENRVLEQAVTLGMLGLVLLLTLGLLLGAERLARLLGQAGIAVVTRIFGILLTALAAEMILQGVKGSGVFR